MSRVWQTPGFYQPSTIASSIKPHWKGRTEYSKPIHKNNYQVFRFRCKASYDDHTWYLNRRDGYIPPNKQVSRRFCLETPTRGTWLAFVCRILYPKGTYYRLHGWVMSCRSVLCPGQKAPRSDGKCNASIRALSAASPPRFTSPKLPYISCCHVLQSMELFSSLLVWNCIWR